MSKREITLFVLICAMGVALDVAWLVQRALRRES